VRDSMPGVRRRNRRYGSATLRAPTGRRAERESRPVKCRFLRCAPRRPVGSNQIAPAGSPRLSPTPPVGAPRGPAGSTIVKFPRLGETRDYINDGICD
jgi:hypothetical protein